MRCHNILNWLLSREELERPPRDAFYKFQLSVRVTAKCRFNAAERLRRQGRFAFFSTTLLSLGLIFIPLMQNTNVELAFPPTVLNMMSTFLAVAVLVYSVVIGTAQYEARADKLGQCADHLKALNRELDSPRQQDDDHEAILARLHKEYSRLLADTENHKRIDYLAATLEMKRDYPITGLVRLYRHIRLVLQSLLPYFLPLLLLILEAVFISDMLKISQLLPALLRK
ncbi:MAG: SLATT domain-containing protein [Cardiobacterium sp.]|jgi:hypothetical protein|nr:MAG: SLATT domain-containing protein [Cardiobacterium sp.]